MRTERTDRATSRRVRGRIWRRKTEGPSRAGTAPELRQEDILLECGDYLGALRKSVGMLGQWRRGALVPNERWFALTLGHMADALAGLGDKAGALELANERYMTGRSLTGQVAASDASLQTGMIHQQSGDYPLAAYHFTICVGIEIELKTARDAEGRRRTTPDTPSVLLGWGDPGSLSDRIISAHEIGQRAMDQHLAAPGLINGYILDFQRMYQTTGWPMQGEADTDHGPN
jgi:hypothetical protein